MPQIVADVGKYVSSSLSLLRCSRMRVERYQTESSCSFSKNSSLSALSSSLIIIADNQLVIDD